jgi:subtilase family serine protease
MKKTKAVKKENTSFYQNRFLVAFLVLTFIVLSATFSVFTKLSNAQVTPNFQAAAGQSNKPVCPGPAGNGETRCHARVIVDDKGNPNATTGPTGYGPAQFLGAYNLSPLTSTNRTIAIVDAYDHPNALADLNTYSKAFNIPQMASCPVSAGTTTTPCFQKVNQRGGNSYPSPNAGWALEISLDIEAAHAVCQNCNILLVESDSNSYTNLMAAVDRARIMGANVVSNSYGSSEFPSETSYDSYFNHPGIAYTVSSGDNGYGVQYPAASQYVTAVGGTTLKLSGNSYLSETAWGGSGSGCSLYETKPSFQTDSGCLKRTVADVSADADPNTGAAVYDSFRYQGQKGWFKVGGTSLAAPLVAATYALGGVPSGVQANSLPYSSGNSSNLHDIVIGSNGNCSPSYLCKAGAGYDGPTGLGSPSGSTSF